MQNTLRMKRESLKLSQEKLAQISGISRQTISLIENGQLKSINSKTMLKLALALNCDVGDIFFKENVVFTQQKQFPTDS